MATALEFLNLNLEEMNSEKMDLEDELDMVLSKIKENEKFLELLRDEDKRVFSEFTPHEANAKNKERMQQTEQELSAMRENRDNLKKRLDSIQDRIGGCEAAILELSPSEDIDLQENDSLIYDDNHVNDKVVTYIHDLENISGYLLNDPRRAKLELDHLIQEISSK